MTGRAFLSPAVVVERPLATPPPRPGSTHAILLLHGSLESYPGADTPRGKKRTAPFSRREVLDAGFSWAALGHHHHLHLVEDDAGVPRGAYSGCPTGRGLDEAGPRFFLKVTLAPGESPRVETLPADGRTVHDLSVDATELEAGALAERIETAWAAAGVRAGDLVRLTLTGVQPWGARPAETARAFASRAGHVAVRDLTAPPAEDPGLRSAEGRFVADLAARRDAAVEEEAAPPRRARAAPRARRARGPAVLPPGAGGLVRIERIRVEGFGALHGLDLAWPEGCVLLAVDPNETGKTTLCEAIVTALYGLPKTRGVAGRVRELRRPRNGAPMRVGLDVSAAGRRWSVDRDLDAGTLQVVDRDRGDDATAEFLRPADGTSSARPSRAGSASRSSARRPT